MALTVIQRPSDQYKQDAQDVLEAAKKEGFETVVILGLRDGEIHITSSGLVSRLQILGACEAAKMHVWGNE
jgi:hypothetical protein